MTEEKTKTTRIQRWVEATTNLIAFLSTGIWSDPRRSRGLNILRTASLSVRSFLNRDIQTQACAMTYRTLLAVVPALALFLAIGRGFGIQDILQNELLRLFPAQRMAIRYSMSFVNAYLENASEGIIVGIGIVFLLYTLISLLSNVEDSFNLIWGQKTGRSLWRKLTDYTAMLLILPILMLCASGISIMISSTLTDIFNFSFMTPVISLLLESLSWVISILFFTAAYILIPNTKVKFKNALISGVIAGLAFRVLQWLFVSGTLYVTKYNAIYGSFAFVPLFLLWMQLAWVICLTGTIICYSSQNVFAFSLDREVTSISPRYRDLVTIAITAVVTQRFVNHQQPITARGLMDGYEIPARLVTGITDRLVAAGIFNRVLVSNDIDECGFQLAIDPSTFSVGDLRKYIYNFGASDFIIDFDERFGSVIQAFEHMRAALDKVSESVLIKDLKIENITTQH